SFVVESWGKTRGGTSGAGREKHGSSFCQAAECLAPAARRLDLDGGERGAQSCGMSRPRDQFEITADILLRAYSIGLFPMAETATDENLFWVDPDARGGYRPLI